MTAPRERVHEVLASERGLTLLLALLVLTIFVFPTLGLEGSDELLYIDIMFSVVIVTGVVAASPDRKTRLLLASVALVAIVVKWGSWLSIGAALHSLRVPTTLLAEILFALVILKRVLGAGRVTGHRVQGAIVVYLLLGLSWAHAYEITERLHPGSFARQFPGPLVVNEWIYFSFVTLTTVGYGDMTPVHRISRVLAIGEALTGQLYLAVLLARLVSLEIIARTERRGAGDPPD